MPLHNAVPGVDSSDLAAVDELLCTGTGNCRSTLALLAAGLGRISRIPFRSGRRKVLYANWQYNSYVRSA